MTAPAPKTVFPGDSLCVVGTGACTSIGLSAPATAAAVWAGISGFEEHPCLLNEEGAPYMLAMTPLVDSVLNGSGRYIALSTPAIVEALEPLRRSVRGDCALIAEIALPERRPGLPDDLEQQVVRHVMGLGAERCAIGKVKVAFEGHARGLMVLESAVARLAAGDAEFCLVGGIDSYIDPDTLEWAEENGQLHHPSNAWGFIPGEAASFCLVCSSLTAEKYGLPIKAQLISVSTAFEENRIKTETVCVGEGLTEAIGGVVSHLPEGARVDQTICDQNGEADRADEFGFMLCRLARHFVDPSDYMAPADCWGDVGAASGPLFIALAVFAAEHGYSKGPHTLLWASSEGGERSAALIRTFGNKRRSA